MKTDPWVRGLLASASGSRLLRGLDELTNRPSRADAFHRASPESFPGDISAPLGLGLWGSQGPCGLVRVLSKTEKRKRTLLCHLTKEVRLSLIFHRAHWS